jgi:hypothetical protein
MFLRSLLASIFILCSTPMRATVIATAVYPANGHTYYLLDRSLWTDAEAEAVTLGGHLATVNDPAENDWIYDTFTALVSGEIDDCPCLWIGYNDVDVEGSFEWASGETPAYANWSPGEPNNGGAPPTEPGEQYVHLWGGSHSFAGAWNDAQNYGGGDFMPFGVVEVPEPRALLAVALAVLPFVPRRRTA